MAEGASNQEIVRQLSISIRTVTTHVRNILDKLHLANRTQAALYAVELGITHQAGKESISWSLPEIDGNIHDRTRDLKVVWH